MGLFRYDLPKPECWPPPQDRRSIAATLAYARQRDPVGHQVHTAIALIHLLTLALAPAPAAITYAVLLGYTLLRLPHTWRCYTALLRMPIAWCSLLLAAWMIASLGWSLDPEQGLDEISSLRILLMPLMLWPIIDRAPWLIAASLIGVAIQNLIQFGQGFKVFGLLPEDDERLRGLVHPIKTGAWCATAMCWHAAAIMHGRHRVRLLSVGGFALAAIGLALTGSRGPWIAAILVLPPGLAILAIRRPETRRIVLLVAAVAVVCAAIVAVTFRDQIESRYQSAVTETIEAVEEDEFATSTGLRIGMWKWAWEIFLDSPVIGRGVGSYRKATESVPSYREALARDPDRAHFLSRDHAHSSYLHMLATTGFIGFALLWALLILLLRNAWREPPDHPYVDGTVLVVAAWIIGSQFDAYHMTSQLFGILGLAIALTLFGRAPVRYALSADDAPHEKKSES